MLLYGIFGNIFIIHIFRSDLRAFGSACLEGVYNTTNKKSLIYIDQGSFRDKKENARLLREKCVQGRPRRRKASAWRQRSYFTNPQKNCRQNQLLSSLSTVWSFDLYKDRLLTL